MRYAAPENLIWLWTVPAVFAVAAYGIRRRRHSLARFMGRSFVPASRGGAAPVTGWLAPWIRALVIAVAAALIGVALAQPEWGTDWSQGRTRGRDIFIALDVSRSMLADDVVPTRLERAKSDLMDLVSAIEKSGGYRVGLIAFAGQAVVKCPLTEVYGHVKQVLSKLDDRSVARGGSFIGDAIRTALGAFHDTTENFRDLVLVTDGEDTDSFPLDAAAQARDAGITVYTMGRGDPVAGARIPARGGSGHASEHQSKLDEGMLQRIAEIAGGVYIPARTRTIQLDRFFREVMEPKAKRDRAEAQRRRLCRRFQWFLLPALLLMLLDPLVYGSRQRKTSAHAERGSRTASGEYLPWGGLGIARAPGGARSALLWFLLWPASGGGAIWSAAAQGAPGQLLACAIVSVVAQVGRAGADDPASLVREGNRLYDERDFVAAAECYEAAARLDPASAVPLYNRAAALFQTGDFAEAARLYEAARLRAPDQLRPQMNYAIGNCHLEQAVRAHDSDSTAGDEARAALPFYRDAMAEARELGETALGDSVRYNLELAKRLVQQTKRRPPPGQHARDDDQKSARDQDHSGSHAPDRDRAASSTNDSTGQDNAELPDQNRDSSARPAGRERVAQAGELSWDEARQRLDQAIARAQLARASRLDARSKPVDQARVEKDW